MKKLIAIALAIVLVLTLGASVVLAKGPTGAGKAPLYDALDSSTTGWTRAGGADLNNLENAGTFGFAVMNTNANGDLIVEVSLKRGNPGTYNVYVHQNVGGPWSPSLEGQLITNGKGNGSAHVKLTRAPGATDFWVSLVDTISPERYRTTSVQLN